MSRGTWIIAALFLASCGCAGDRNAARLASPVTLAVYEQKTSSSVNSVRFVPSTSTASERANSERVDNEHVDKANEPTVDQDKQLPDSTALASHRDPLAGLNLNQVEPPAGESPAVDPASPQRDLETIPSSATAATSEFEIPENVLSLEQVLDSVASSYPLLQAAIWGRDIAAGEHLAAHGAFDLKLKGASENGLAGFYETYRHSLGFEQPLYGGSSVFGGYRVGRGSFQPWYLERLTNDGGEFKAGVAVPLSRNVEIDARRAKLWSTGLGRELTESEIRLQQIDIDRMAAYAYWDWVAAGKKLRVALELLQLADDRNEAIRKRVELGDVDPPVLQDNRRLIVSRETKVIESSRKLTQSAIKLSMYLRDANGRPSLVQENQLPTVGMPAAPNAENRNPDIEIALANRPELRLLRTVREQLEIEYSLARNDRLPNIQAVTAASQDVGTPASSKNDKSQFELEAALYVDLPYQRRKAQGKMRAVNGKMRQLDAKTQMTRDKIAADVSLVYAAMFAAYRQIERAKESVALAKRLAEVEFRRFDLGESDLLAVNLREQQAAEAQVAEVEAFYDFQVALADYRAALAIPNPAVASGMPGS